MVDGLANWLNVGRVTDALTASMDQDSRNVMITYLREGQLND